MGKKGGGKKGKKDAEPTEPPHDPGWERVRVPPPNPKRGCVPRQWTPHVFLGGWPMGQRAAAPQPPTVERLLLWVAVVTGSMWQRGSPSAARECSLWTTPILCRGLNATAPCTYPRPPSHSPLPRTLADECRHPLLGLGSLGCPPAVDVVAGPAAAPLVPPRHAYIQT